MILKDPDFWPRSLSAAFLLPLWINAEHLGENEVLRAAVGNG